MPISVTEKKIKSKFRCCDRVAATVNVRYPQFDGNGNKKLCKRMNEFYSSVAEKYVSRTKKGVSSRRRMLSRHAVTVSMSYMIARCDEKLVSVVLDLAVSEGKNVKMRRFSQMWSVERQDIIRHTDIINTDRRAVKTIFSRVLATAKENAENSAFGYYDDYAARLKKSFDVSCCFAVPTGICFFVNAGVLSPLKYGVCNFVIANDVLSGIVRQGFEPYCVEKAENETDIVNNI